MREKVTLQTDGQLKTGRDVAIAALLGAEEYGFATVPLIALGCIMMRKCHLNTCPVGIATQDPVLRAKYGGQPEHVINFFYFLANELREIMAQLGFERMDDMIGRSDYLKVKDINHILNNSKQVDLSPLLVSSENIHQQSSWNHKDNGLDSKLVEMCDKVIKGKDPNRMQLRNINIYNTNRAVGATLSHEIAKNYGSKGLESEDSIKLHFLGCAGQSFGMCLVKGVTFLLEGEANDFVGKSLSGGVISLYPSKNAGNGLIRRESDKNVIAGNACLYGATSGKVFISGRAGERFAVRNSGASAVVEGVGNHGCEYMTGGCVVILGKIGKNFAAGMSGGMAFVLKEEKEEDLLEKFLYINEESINLGERITDSDLELITDMIQEHIEHTDSIKAKKVMGMFLDLDENGRKNMFIKILPREYKKVLMKQEMEKTKKKLESELSGLKMESF